MADDVTRDLLTQWGLESLKESFRDAEITQSVLEAIDPDAPNYIVEQLIPSYGKRILFNSGLKKYKTLLTYANSDTPYIIIPAEDPAEILKDDSVDPMATPLINVETVFRPDSEAKATEIGGRMGTSGRPKVVYPVCLPDLPRYIQKDVEAGEVERCYHLMIRQFGNHLLSLTDGCPSAKDYGNISRSIVEKYPALKDANSYKLHASVSQQLSHYIRNKRYRDNKIVFDAAKQEPSKRKRMYQSMGKTSNPVKDDSSSESAAGGSSMPTGSVKGCEEHELLKQLKIQEGCSSVHSKMLLSQTSHVRRKAVLSEDNTVLQIIDEFPHLSNYELLQYDIHLLDTVKEEVIAASFPNIVKKLNNLMENQHCLSLNEVEALELFQTLESTLHPKRVNGY